MADVTLPYDKDAHYYYLSLNPEPWKVGPVNNRHVGQDPSLAAYQEGVREQLLKYTPLLLKGSVDLEFWFWHTRVRYQGAKKIVVKNAVDVTNLQKATEDAVQGILIDNDRNVVNVHSHMVAQGEDIQGAVVVKVSPARPAPIHLLPEEILEQIAAGPTLPTTDNKW